MTTSHFPLVIIGAGAAGLGAACKAREMGINHIVLEASHRIGGRALTEHLDNGVAIDLGCHWMHCASQNIMVEKADQLGFDYLKSSPEVTSFSNSTWQPAQLDTAREKFSLDINQRMAAAYKEGSRSAVWDFMDADSPHMPWFSYWYSLMHSSDPDEVNIADIIEFADTGEDWPVKQGYGALVAAAGAGSNVRLNTVVKFVRLTQKGVTLETSSGGLTADRVLVTVSTGVLGSGDIKFDPILPDWKQKAITALPLGNYNNLFFQLVSGSLSDVPAVIAYENSDHCGYLNVRPFGENMVFTAVAGRFAWWLEKQGENAAALWFGDILADIFGSDVRRNLGRFKASAWGFDHWVKGAYSSQIPGVDGMRKLLAMPLENKLYFAGEAVSERIFNTAHGAWVSGEDAVENIAAQ